MAQWWECTPPSAYQCGPGSNPGVDAICGLGLLLVLSFAPRGFSPSTPVSRSPQKPIFPNSNSTRNQVDEYPLCGCAISKSLFIYFLLKFDRHPSKLVNINRQSSKLPPYWDTLFRELIKGSFGRAVPPRRAFKSSPRSKTKIVHFATLFNKRDPILWP